MLVDSHCHLDWLDLTKYDNDLSLALKAASEQGVNYFLSVSVDLESFPKLVEIAESFSNVFISVGLHPNEVITKEPTVEEMIALAKHPKVVAIGETGLDYYRNEVSIATQKQRFLTQIQVARAVNKPLIIHSRNARQDTLDFMRNEKLAEISGVLHCFTEDLSMALQAIDLNFYISFSGIVTFQNAKELKEVARQVPLDRILVETDAPYLAPVPHRGKSNEPAFVYHTAVYLADLKNVEFNELAQRTTQNFFELFKDAQH